MAALVILAAWLVLFFCGTALAARAAKQPVWLFARAEGRAKYAALGFRLAFALALAGPLLSRALPEAAAHDPLSSAPWPLAGAGIAATGALLALVAQAQMGRSWRVGVADGNAGALVTTGLFRLSRNPAFLGQATMLTGVALAQPGIATLAAPALFLASAQLQIHEEERLLKTTHGTAWVRWAARTPRWLLR